MEYKTQIKSPLWQKKRLEVLQAANFKCQNCGCEDKQLHVHHTYYEKGRDIWDYDNEDLMVLCDSCHSYVHAYGRNWLINDYESYIIKKLRKTNTVIPLANILSDQYHSSSIIDIILDYNGLIEANEMSSISCTSLQNEVSYLKKILSDNDIEYEELTFDQYYWYDEI